MTVIKNGMRPIHPGEILREEFLIPLGLSAHALAMSLQVPAPRINCRGVLLELLCAKPLAHS